MSKTAFKYVGPGRHYGVPSRDITAEEFETLSPRQRRIITESAVYEAVAPPPAPTRAELEERARTLGIDEPFSRFKTKDDLQEAIADAEQGGGNGNQEVSDGH